MSATHRITSISRRAALVAAVASSRRTLQTPVVGVGHTTCTRGRLWVVESLLVTLATLLAWLSTPNVAGAAAPTPASGWSGSITVTGHYGFNTGSPPTTHVGNMTSVYFFDGSITSFAPPHFDSELGNTTQWLQPASWSGAISERNTQADVPCGDGTFTFVSQYSARGSGRSSASVRYRSLPSLGASISGGGALPDTSTMSGTGTVNGCVAPGVVHTDVTSPTGIGPCGFGVDVPVVAFGDVLSGSVIAPPGSACPTQFTDVRIDFNLRRGIVDDDTDGRDDLTQDNCIPANLPGTRDDGGVTVPASYNPDQSKNPCAHTLTIHHQGANAADGTVTSNDQTVCPAICVRSFPAGTVVHLVPQGNTGSAFDHWEGACTGSGACNVTINADKTVTAVFKASHTLTVARTGDGSGSVASAPAGITCPTTCVVSFPLGTSVTLTATAAAGSHFTGWDGACGGASATCTVTMSAARSVTAGFARNLAALTVARSGPGAGSVSGPGIDCGSDCAEQYAMGSRVTLSPHPDAGSRFDHWEGACSGSSLCDLTMNAAKSAIAVFSLVCDGVTAPEVRGVRPQWRKTDALSSFPNSDAMCDAIWLPGIDDGFVAQGLALRGDGTALISGYLHPGKNRCRLIVVDLATTDVVQGPRDFGPKGWCHHGGGVAIDPAGHIWLADTDRLFMFAGMNAPVPQSVALKGLHGSFLIEGGADDLSIGDFDKARRYQFSYSQLTAALGGQLRAKDALTDDKLPRKPQGATFGPGGLWVTSSTASCGQITVGSGSPVGFGPGAEEIAFATDGTLWAVFEAGSTETKKPNLNKRFLPVIAQFDPARLLHPSACGF